MDFFNGQRKVPPKRERRQVKMERDVPWGTLENHGTMTNREKPFCSDGVCLCGTTHPTRQPENNTPLSNETSRLVALQRTTPSTLHRPRWVTTHLGQTVEMANGLALCSCQTSKNSLSPTKRGEYCSPTKHPPNQESSEWLFFVSGWKPKLDDFV